MVVHGGLFHTEDVLLSELNAIDRVAFSLKDLPDGGEKREPFPRYHSFALYPREQVSEETTIMTTNDENPIITHLIPSTPSAHNMPLKTRFPTPFSPSPFPFPLSI